MNENNTSKSELSSEVTLSPSTEVVERPQSPNERSSQVLPIEETLERYLSAIRGIGHTASIGLPHIAKWKISEIEKTQKKIEKFIPEGTEDDGVFTLDSARDFVEFSNSIRQLEELRTQDSTGVLAKSLFTQLFAEFDAYIGELLKVIYLKDEKLLKGITREISLSDLLDFEDLNAVKLSMLDKEIETFRRDSYVEQFSTLEKKFNITLKKFKEWSEFVELSQRRNILTHNGGVVSDQYLIICDREGHRFSNKPKLGESLGVTFQYFSKASLLLSKVGLMLAYTLWFKVFPKESEQIHRALNESIFQCLQQGRWKFVAELEDFILGPQMRKEISEIDYRIRIVNTSIGLKFSGRDSDAIALLTSVDWSASYRDFKLAIAVLHEKYVEAVEIMKSIGKSGEIIVQHSYHSWPLFSKFRERTEFYEAYFHIYGETFAEKVETDKGSVEAHAQSTKIVGSKKLRKQVSDVEPKNIDLPAKRKPSRSKGTK